MPFGLLTVHHLVATPKTSTPDSPAPMRPLSWSLRARLLSFTSTSEVARSYHFEPLRKVSANQRQSLVKAGSAAGQELWCSIRSSYSQEHDYDERQFPIPIDFRACCTAVYRIRHRLRLACSRDHGSKLFSFLTRQKPPNPASTSIRHVRHAFAAVLAVCLVLQSLYQSSLSICCYLLFLKLFTFHTQA